MTLDGEALTNRSASGHGKITIRMTVDVHYVLVQCRGTGKTRA